MCFAPFPIIFRRLDKKLCVFKNHDFLDFLCLNSVRILGQKKSGKSWILKTHNFWSKRRNIIGNGAKQIYFIQRIHWKIFQVWVLTRNSSSEKFSFYVKSVKMQKKKKNQNFQDEFLGGSSDFNDEIWSEMEIMGVLDVFCTNSECATTSRSNFRPNRFLWILDFWFVGFVIRPSKFRPPGRISADWYYFRKKYDHISLPFEIVKLTRITLLCNQIFVIFAQFP